MSCLTFVHSVAFFFLLFTDVTDALGKTDASRVIASPRCSYTTRLLSEFGEAHRRELEENVWSGVERCSAAQQRNLPGKLRGGVGLSSWWALAPSLLLLAFLGDSTMLGSATDGIRSTTLESSRSRRGTKPIRTTRTSNNPRGVRLAQRIRNICKQQKEKCDAVYKR